MFNIKNNFLSNKEYKEIYNILTNEAFPWYYNNYKGTKEEKLLEYEDKWYARVEKYYKMQK